MTIRCRGGRVSIMRQAYPFAPSLSKPEHAIRWAWPFVRRPCGPAGPARRCLIARYRALAARIRTADPPLASAHYHLQSAGVCGHARLMTERFQFRLEGDSARVGFELEGPVAAADIRKVDGSLRVEIPIQY